MWRNLGGEKVGLAGGWLKKLQASEACSVRRNYATERSCRVWGSQSLKLKMVRGLQLRWSFINLVFTILLIKPSLGGLTIAKPCGQVLCTEMEFCSPYGHICKACSDVCVINSHNYHVNTCHLQCQDYLHIKKSARDAVTLAELSRNVRLLLLAAWLGVAFSGLGALLLLGMCASKVSRARRRHGGLAVLLRNSLCTSKGSQKVDDKEKGVIQGLKLDIPPPLAMSQSSLTAPSIESTIASTTLPATPPLPPPLSSSKLRSPTEDKTLDFAYDNPGLSTSSVCTKPGGKPILRKETDF